MKLVDDKGLEEYDIVKEAYNKAKAILTQENPNRQELSDLLDVLDKNPKGVEWLRDEEGKNFDEAHNKMLDKICLAYKISENQTKCIAIIFPQMGYAVGYGGDKPHVIKIEKEDKHELAHLLVCNEAPDIILGHINKTKEHKFELTIRKDRIFKGERINPEFAEKVKEYAEYNLEGAHFGKIAELKQTEELLVSMIQKVYVPGYDGW